MTILNLAILIDAENVMPSFADQIFEHAKSLGTIVAKEIYGTAQALNTWVAPVLRYAIHPNLTIRASKGKNSSDISLVIGCMDLMTRSDLNAMIIASSDSDFSSLSVRLRNAGIEVIGMGTDKANELWRTACTSFVVFQSKSTAKASPATVIPSSRPQPAAPQSSVSSKPTIPQPAPIAVSQTVQVQPSKPVPSAPLNPPKESTPAAGKAQGSSGQQNGHRKPIADTHAGRLQVIKQFITEQLQSAGGRMLTTTLFSSLNSLPEYRFDQQKSKRRPLNYLTRQYNDVFVFEEKEGQTYIELPSFAVSEASKPDAKRTASDKAAEKKEASISAKEMEKEAETATSEIESFQNKEENALPTNEAEDQSSQSSPSGEPVKDARESEDSASIPSSEEEKTSPLETSDSEFSQSDSSPAYSNPVNAEENPPVEEDNQLEEEPFENSKAVSESGSAEIAMQPENAAASVAEPQIPAENADTEPAESHETDPLQLLLDAGFPPEDAPVVVSIFNESSSLRVAYNKLRSRFGNNLGRDYYYKVKEIAGQQ